MGIALLHYSLTKLNIMKKLNIFLIISVIHFNILFAQTSAVSQSNKAKVAVLNIDVDGILSDPVSVGNMVRLELEKTKTYRVLDRYDMLDYIEKNDFNIEACYGLDCLVKMGKAFKVHKIISGRVERFGEKVVFTIRLINVNKATIEKTQVNEFLNMQSELQRMAEVAVKDLLGIENDPLVLNNLTYYDSPISSPKTALILSGPRMGAAYITGDMAQRLQDPLNRGGYDSYPLLSQFGYQHEVQYLSSGNLQGLFEILFMVGGLEQQLFIPSLILMNGFRDSKTGLEIAFGPSISLRKKAKGFYDTDGILGKKGEWRLEKEWSSAQKDSFGYPLAMPNEYKLVERMDKRGDIAFVTGWVWSIGKTFRSGHLNIPVNAYVSPRREGWLIGLSMGFNVRKRRAVK